MIFAIEPLSQCWDEKTELAKLHWKETERPGQNLNIIFDRYNQYDKAGWYFEATARVEGRLVGNAGMYITPSMHTQQIIATEDSWFMLPEYRKGWNAIKFYRFVEEECKKRGAVEITMTAKMTNTAGRLMELMGYNLTSQQYTKTLVRADSTSDMKEDDVFTKSAATA